MLPNSAFSQLDETPPLRVLRLREVKQRTGLSQSGIYAKMARGQFPRTIPLGALAVGWLAHEIDDWIAGRIAERDANSSAAA
jgi:prophage regulatory protein